ncbi:MULTISPECIES: YetF domain-containing protein [Rhodopseudomonas]|uniref:DUF421 domain-containing protein n=1 Tax=Rhodopseudomonas TaxID=1073 RepID=UPI0009BA23BC|nr:MULTISPECIES: YetF domain-containing protein [Rhodopseudomonas]MDF3808704.1 DUF421 domain-containing protein [Rhodopseudomonas sp. BAL398]WOK19774.1 DUF421 domain-containing protein [Rhodopseudomonas sp. BAL398]
MSSESWSGIVQILWVAPLAYAALVALLRLSGKRTLTKLNAFDLVVTVALGSTLATVLLNKNVTLMEGVLAIALLIGFQFAITWASLRLPWFKNLVKSEPTLLLRNGAFIESALRAQRVTRDEVAAVLRGKGISHAGEVDAVVLETDGSFSVMRSVDWNKASTLQGVDLAAVDEAGEQSGAPPVPSRVSSARGPRPQPSRQ